MHTPRNVDSDDHIESLLPAVPETVHPLAKEVARALEGAVYPLSRAEVLLIARENEAPRMLLSLLQRLPNQRFLSEADVTQAADEQPAPV